MIVLVVTVTVLLPNTYIPPPCEGKNDCSGFTTLQRGDGLLRNGSSILEAAHVGLLGGLTSAVISAWFDTTRGGDADSARPAGAKAAAAQVVALLGVGLVGVKVFDACTWSRALTLVTDVLVTAGLGDVIPTTKACRLFVSLYAPLAVVTFARVIGTLALRPLETARRRAQRRLKRP